jgi:hypothetical protein
MCVCVLAERWKSREGSANAPRSDLGWLLFEELVDLGQVPLVFR